MPVLPRGGDEELNREGQVSSRRVGAASVATASIPAQSLMPSLIHAETTGRLPKQPAEDAHVQELPRNGSSVFSGDKSQMRCSQKLESTFVLSQMEFIDASQLSFIHDLGPKGL